MQHMLYAHTVWSKSDVGQEMHELARRVQTSPALQTVWNWKVSVQSGGNSVTNQKGVVQPP